MSLTHASSISTATIIDTAHDGRGIAKIQGKTVFIEGALPEEIVEFKLMKQHARYDDAVVQRIISPSTHRVKPACPHIDQCGGCQLQHLDSNQQILFKQRHILNQLKHIGHIHPPIQNHQLLPALTASHWHYRQKIKLGLKRIKKTGELYLGFHDKTGKNIINITECALTDKRANISLLPSIKAILGTLSPNVLDQTPHVQILCDALQCLWSFEFSGNLSTINPQDRQKIDQLIQLGKNHAVNIHWQDLSSSMTPPVMTYFVNKLKLHFQPTDFIQINPEINQKMVNLAVKLLDLQPSDTVLDLFCGLGNFSLPIATQAGSVTGIDKDQSSIRQARKNATLNNLLNTQFHCADLFYPSASNIQNLKKEKYTKLVLDPPRTGAKAILSLLPHWKPERIVYISCNPSTLARDLNILVNQQKYQITQLAVIDMFPQTKHIESIVLLNK